MYMYVYSINSWFRLKKWWEEPVLLCFIKQDRTIFSTAETKLIADVDQGM